MDGERVVDWSDWPACCRPADGVTIDWHHVLDTRLHPLPRVLFDPLHDVWIKPIYAGLLVGTEWEYVDPPGASPDGPWH